jgi:type I restriction-modification system DNA methylase subunit
MALFQEAIIRKHLLTLDAHLLDSAYNEYKRVYSPEKIKNIRVAKEEQYQEGFIKEIFGSVLGYSVYPESPFNIETEKKNETNARKADGAILSGEKVVGVIELKDNKTKNLDAVKDQAFGYKNNHKDCSYVISSNFHKLRFYIDDATDYEEFDLYNLDKETFKRFYLYLRKEGLLDKNLPKLLRQETKFHEEEISKKLYKDYSNFKRRFFENAVKNNPQHDKLELFKKSQKFLDRILFLLFAEDKGLVGTNSIVSIVEKWSGADDDYYQPLYEMVNKYFGHLFRGYTYQKTGEVIPQFGGELFAPDEMLESLKIDDEVLKNDLLILSKYDFNTDVDVNILGHIFEHSLNEVDDVEAELRGETLDKSKSKRKKDGVFYTPKYITKYIVDNTLGKLCNEKKIELKLDEDIAIFDYQKADGKLNEKGKELYERLNTYKSWLLTVKVCDPACGSGAFLNQALSYFIEEHKFVDDIIAELTNTPLRLFDTDLQILENNIFGVDINDESVEIAKLSMWLRTAQPGRKLSDLSNNIKCGNSLIDDPAVAGDKAFNWEKEFPTVFEKGGFDVVIGNPPYVQLSKLSSTTESEKKYLIEKYSTSGGRLNTYIFFIHLIEIILKKDGLSSYIIPNTILTQEYYSETRELILKKLNLYQIVNYPIMPFSDAVVDSVTLFMKKSNLINEIGVFNQEPHITSLQRQIQKSTLENNYNYNFEVNGDKVTAKIESLNLKKLGDLLEINQAIALKGDKNLSVKSIFEKGLLKLIDGKHINRFQINWGGDFLDYNVDKIHSCKRRDIFESSEKLFFRRVSSTLVFTYDNEQYFALNTLIVLNSKPDCPYSLKALLAVLNSKLMNHFYVNKYKSTKKVFSEIQASTVKLLPIAEISLQNDFIIKVDLIIDLSKELKEIVNKFLNLMGSDFKLDKISKRLEDFYILNWSEFEKELNKNKIYLLGVQKDDWFDRFERFKKQALDLKTIIDQTDKEIDRMVYVLYGLTEEEVQIVENS